MKLCLISRDKNEWKAVFHTSVSFAFIESVTVPRKKHASPEAFAQWLRMTDGEEFTVISKRRFEKCIEDHKSQFLGLGGNYNVT